MIPMEWRTYDFAGEAAGLFYFTAGCLAFALVMLLATLFWN